MELEQLNHLRQFCLDNAANKPRSIELAAKMQSQLEEQMSFQASLSILDSIGYAVIATDIEAKITYLNRYAEVLYQWPAAEAIGKNIHQVTVASSSRQQAAEILMNVAIQGEWRGKILLQRRDGAEFWGDITTTAIADENNHIQGFVQVSIGSSDRQEAQCLPPQKVKANESLLNTIPDAMFWLDKDGTLLDYQIPKNFPVKLNASKFLSQNIADVLPSELAKRAKQHLEKAIFTGNLESLEYQFQSKGKILTFEARILANSPDEVLAIVRNITETKQAENHLEQSEERYRTVSELISDFAYSANINSDGRLVIDWITGAFSRITGFSWEEIEARGGWKTIIHPDDVQIFKDRLQRILCWQSDVSEYRIFAKDGKIRWLRDYSQPVYCDDENRLLIIYGAAQDITDRKQAEDVLRQKNERERLLGMMQERIRQSLDLDEILNQAVAEVRNFLQVERVAVYQINNKNSGKFVVESINNKDLSVIDISCEDPCFNENYVNKYEQGQVSAIDNIYQANLSPCHLDLLAKIKIKANLVVPIVLNNKLWGLLCAHQCSEPRYWQPFEIDLLQQLATTVALAIQQSSLFKQIQKLNSQLEKQVIERTAEVQKALDFEAMLKRITDKVRDSLDEDQILETAVREVAIGLNINSCNAAIYDLEEGTSTVCHDYAVCIPANQGRVAQMANFPELYSQLLQKHYFQFCSILPNPDRGRVAMLACPIFDNKGVLGDLWLVNRHDYSFSELEIRLVQQVANQCAIAIRQARLYQAAQTQVAELEKLNSELEKLNMLKDDFLSTVSHELRTPMANMKMAIQMLKIVPSGDRHQRYLEILKTECDRETELINDLLDLQRLEASSYPLSLAEAVNLEAWLPNIVEPFRTRAQDRKQKLEVELFPDVPPLITDRAGLGRIIAELLNNACKYTPSDGAIVLQISYQLPKDDGESIETEEANLENQNSQISSLTDSIYPVCHTETNSISSISNISAVAMTVITVKNEVEIPSSELPHLFKKFYRVLQADLWKQGGTGLGLALVQKLVEQMQGNINVKSCDGWTTFRIELPNR